MREPLAAPQLYAGPAAVRASLPISPQSQTTRRSRPTIPATPKGPRLYAPPTPSVNTRFGGAESLAKGALGVTANEKGNAAYRPCPARYR